MHDPQRSTAGDTLQGHEAAAVYDPLRLAEIARLGLDRAQRDDVLDALTATAARDLAMPSGTLSIVLDEAQLIIASSGMSGWILETSGVPVEWGVCRLTIGAHAPVVIEDMTQHADTRDNPFVVQDGLRCYAGVPLVSSRGIAVGSLCVSGGEPRPFTDADIARLVELARTAMTHLEARATR